MWTWNAQRKPRERLDDVAQEADRTIDWDFIGIQGVSTTAEYIDNKAHTTQAGHMFIITMRPPGGFSVAIFVHVRWRSTVTDITFGHRLVAVVAKIRTGRRLHDNTTLQFLAGHAPPSSTPQRWRSAGSGRRWQERCEENTTRTTSRDAGRHMRQMEESTAHSRGHSSGQKTRIEGAHARNANDARQHDGEVVERVPPPLLDVRQGIRRRSAAKR